MFVYPLIGEAPNNFIFPIDYQSGSVDVLETTNFPSEFGQAGNNIPAGAQYDSAQDIWPTGITGSFWIKPTGYSAPVTYQLYDRFNNPQGTGGGNGDGTTTVTENQIFGMADDYSPGATFNTQRDNPWIFLHQDSSGATMLRWIFKKDNDAGSDSTVGYEVELPQNQWTHVTFNHVFWRVSAPNAIYSSYLQCYLNGVPQHSEDSGGVAPTGTAFPYVSTWHSPNGWVPQDRLALVGTKISSYRVHVLALADNIPRNEKWRIGGSHIFWTSDDQRVLDEENMPKFQGQLAQIYMGGWSQDLQFNIDAFYNNGAVNMGPSGITTGLPTPQLYTSNNLSNISTDFIPTLDSAGGVELNGTLLDTDFNV